MLWAFICKNLCFKCINSRSKMTGSYDRCSFNILWICLKVFQNGFTLLLGMYKGSSSYPSLPTLDMVTPLNIRHSGWWVRVSLCGFNLLFSNDKFCWGSFHLHLRQLWIFMLLLKCRLQSLPMFWIRLFVLLPLHCKLFVYSKQKLSARYLFCKCFLSVWYNH